MNALHCPLWHPITCQTFSLYEINLSDSVAGPVKFFSEQEEDLDHDSGVVAMRASIQWENLPLRGGMKKLAPKIQTECGGSSAFDLPFLSKNTSTLAVWCRIHGHFKGNKLTILQAFINRKPGPKIKPPKEMTAFDETLGGYPTGFEKMLNGIGKLDPHPCTARAEFLCMSAKLKIVPNRGFKGFGPFRFSEEEITFKAKDGTSIRIELSKKHQSVNVESYLELVPDAECFENACQLLINKIQSIFKRT